MIARTPAPSRRRALLTVLLPLPLALAAYGCGAAGATDGGSDGGTITLTSPTTSVSLLQGATQSVALSVTRTGYSAPLTLSVDGLPTGVTAAFNPATLTGAVLTSTLTLTAAMDAPASLFLIRVLASGADSTRSEIPISLQVFRPQVIVSRNGTGTGTVTSNPAGINCGSACNTTFQAGTSVTLTATPANGNAFAGWAGGVCAGSVTTCVFTLTTAANVTATFNSTAQAFSIGLDQSTASVAQGGNTTATANINRVNGYAGAVTFALTGAPSGITISTNPNITGNTATLSIAATSAVPVGNFPIGISATGTGVTGTQTATLNLHVTSAPGGSGDVAFSFANCDPGALPIWFAAQNGTGAWTKITPSNNTFTFTVGATGAFAWVTPDGTGFSTTTFYGSHDEIVSLALGSFCGGLIPAAGTKRLTSSATGILTTAFATVTIGGASVQIHQPQMNSWTLDSVPPGRRDLLAVITVVNANGSLGFPRLILRRDVNYATTIPPLDFNSVEAAVPAFTPISTTNGLPDQISLGASFLTSNGISSPYMSGLGGPNGGVGYAGVPDTLLQPSDLHVVEVDATPTGGSSIRTAILMHHSVVGDNVTFGPKLNQPTVSSVATSPYLRLHAQLASQAEYNAAALAQFGQGANVVAVFKTAAYLGATPATWAIDIPDFAGAGYDPAWALKTGTAVDWQVYAASGSFLPLLGATPVDGQRMLFAGVGSTSSSFDRLRPITLWTRRR